MNTVMGVRSFDESRDREAPDVIEGHWLNGMRATIRLSEPTLIVAVKSSCDGCREFVESDLEELSRTPVIVVSASEDLGEEWVNAHQPVLVSPSALDALQIRWPPFYVLVDPRRRRVITEGVVFGAAQVASEIEQYLRP